MGIEWTRGGWTTVVSAVRRLECFLSVRLDSKVKSAIATIAADAWTTIIAGASPCRCRPTRPAAGTGPQSLHGW